MLSKITLHVPGAFYNRTFNDLVDACACDEVFPDITEQNFPRTTESSSDRDITLVCCHEILSSEELAAKLDAEGLVPGNNGDLLAVIAAHPTIITNSPILQVGQTWHHGCGCRYVTMFYIKGQTRKLWIDWDESDWPANCWVIAVPKVA